MKIVYQPWVEARSWILAVISELERVVVRNVLTILWWTCSMVSTELTESTRVSLIYRIL